MLIVSNALLVDPNPTAAWSNSTQKRRPEDYTLIEGRGLTTVERIVRDLADKIAPESETGIPVTKLIRVLGQWAAVSETEKRVWETKGSANAPIFDPATWNDRGSDRAEVRIYDNAVDLILGIIGYIRSRWAESIEKEYANNVLKNRKVAELVKTAAGKLSSALPDRAPTDVVAQEYKKLHGINTLSEWKGKLNSLDTATNIMVIHDVANWLDNAGRWNSAWNVDAVGPEIKERGFVNKQTMRHNVGTVNEDTPWTERARFYDLPTWAGPSGTTETLCRALCQVGRVLDDELVACVYGLYAVWASDLYPKKATPIHHLYGVMTGAKDYLPAQWKPAAEAGNVYDWLQAFLIEGTTIRRLAKL